MIRIQADFNTIASFADGKTVQLRDDSIPSGVAPGTRVILYEPNDFEFEAILEMDISHDGTIFWRGILDLDTFRDISAQA